ncbi:nucleotidyltransferase domain-containing protein [Clostridium sp. D53t1_180928_C8]|uniref:nucleotidyltransferase domain-containing protein n=1 Tax=Clostridium sp. D53t1_180928_C8 TaxID=2787101 RepID=UPI0018A96B9C|nr:nucleotidyltransferase domain-containing protein [Clostridium sp. D53t1_180928_C8]
MRDYIKEKLEERNERIINAIIKKANTICPKSIAFIGIYGSFYSGDIHEKSDLDLCIVINDDDGWKISKCFILEDVAFDIYCTPWSLLEYMAEYKDPYIAKLLDLNIVYVNDEKYLDRYKKLREKALDKLNSEFSSEDNEKAEGFVNDALKEYANVMISSEYSECRHKVAEMLYYIEQAIYMYNKKYILRGVKRIPEELAMMDKLPIEFNTLYNKSVKVESCEEIKNIATKLMKSVKEFSKDMKLKITEKKEIEAENIRGSYEEIYSNWKNKMYYAAENNDTYLSLMTASSCQSFYDDMYSEYNIEKVDIMKSLDTNLKEAAVVFDKAMEKYKRNYDKVGLTVNKYKDLDEFEENY